MSDQPQAGPPHPTAAVRARSSRRWRFSLIWAIPIVTAAIGGWLAWDTLSQRGPLITITFQTAEGLQAGQSHVKHKDVDMGLVESIALTKDLQHVDVTVRMNREAEPLLTDKAQFWVVKPRFFAGAISGLETLLSGSYIELLPSAAGGKREAGLRRPGGSAGAAIRRSRPHIPAASRRGSAASALARRSSTGTSRSARCSGGTSATWPRASPFTLLSARRSTPTCMMVRASGMRPVSR